MRITVRGIPAPQGSKRPVRLGNGRIGMVESSRAVSPWREAVRAETQRAMSGRGPYAGPVWVQVRFAMPRPKSLKKGITYHAKRPDLDKLIRAILDGLTAGGAFTDDGQVFDISATKVYANGEPTGCEIFLDTVGEQ